MSFKFILFCSDDVLISSRSRRFFFFGLLVYSHMAICTSFFNLFTDSHRSFFRQVSQFALSRVLCANANFFEIIPFLWFHLKITFVNLLWVVWFWCSYLIHWFYILCKSVVVWLKIRSVVFGYDTNCWKREKL